MVYDFIIIGGGIAGSSVAYFLSQKTKNILLVEKNKIASGGSGAAGAFLSPLLGKPNKFKDLVNIALKFSINFYKTKTPDLIYTPGVLRLPKNEVDIEKFNSFEAYNPFEYKKINGGFYFPIGSVVKSKDICYTLTKCINVIEGFKINSIIKKEGFYLINNELKTKSIILATGFEVDLVDEFYIKKSIRPIWGQRIEVLSKSETKINYHKNCSVSVSEKFQDRFKISIGATHHRFVTQKKVNDKDTQELLKYANEIVTLKDIEVINKIGGVRSASIDYFPIVGELIDSKKTINKFPYLIHGTKVPSNLFDRYKNFYIFNGLGGRGFVLAPYLAKNFVSFIFNEEKLIDEVKLDRLFIREVKRLK